MRPVVILALITLLVGTAVCTQGLRAQDPPGSKGGGYDGDSIANCIVIRIAGDADPAIIRMLEDKTIEFKHPGFTRKSQRVIKKDGKNYEVVTIVNAKGETKDLYFDTNPGTAG